MTDLFKLPADWTHDDIKTAIQKIRSFQDEEDRDYFDFDHDHLGLKSPFEWTADEIHDLVMDTVGVDETFPTGYHILVKIWMPPSMTDHGIHLTDGDRSKEMITSTVGQVLRMGKSVFKDKMRFPEGPLITYGQWGIFKEHARQIIEKNGHRLAFIHDDRFVAVEKNPKTLKTAFDLQVDWRDE